MAICTILNFLRDIFSIGKYPSDIHKLSQIEQFGRVVAVATELEQPC